MKDLSVTIGVKKILDQVSVSVPKGTITAIVGESGSGKTTLALSLLGLLSPVMQISAATLMVDGQSIIGANTAAMNVLRGVKVGMVFQEPLQAFDPLFTVGFQMDETLRIHTSLNRADRRQRMEEILQLAGLPATINVINRYPHQLSGGQRQRAMIALACVCYPSLLIADEPTSSLDSDTQAQVLETFTHLNQTLGMAMLIITHDLNVVKAIAHEIVVLKDGSIVEQGPVQQVINNPMHPYTKRLIEASL